MGETASLSELLKVFEENIPKEIEMVRSSRPYKIPKRYMPWQKLSAIAGLAIYMWHTKPPEAPMITDKVSAPGT